MGFFDWLRRVFGKSKPQAPAPKPAPPPTPIEPAPVSPPSPVPTPISTPAPTAEGPLVSPGWEKNHPERKAWSKFVFDLVTSDELFPIFDSAKDIERFYPRYRSFNKAERGTVWTELISAICLPESGWSPTSTYTEKTMGIDPVTGHQVKSEGLMQLSYQDTISYAGVLKKSTGKIDWTKDKFLAEDDPKKTIFDPFINLECGIRILAHQIEMHGKVILTSGVYWAVLKEGGHYSEIPQIIASVQKLKLPPRAA